MKNIFNHFLLPLLSFLLITFNNKAFCQNSEIISRTYYKSTYQEGDKEKTIFNIKYTLNINLKEDQVELESENKFFEFKIINTKKTQIGGKNVLTIFTISKREYYSFYIFENFEKTVIIWDDRVVVLY